MITGLFTLLAIGSGHPAISAAGGVDWSPTINTFLLVVLAAITAYENREARRGRVYVHERTKETAAAVTDIRSKITGETRDPKARTRKDDD